MSVILEDSEFPPSHVILEWGEEGNEDDIVVHNVNKQSHRLPIVIHNSSTDASHTTDASHITSHAQGPHEHTQSLAPEVKAGVSSHSHPR